ncbi:MAG: glycosyltransferase [Planctomycetes bacterium]|nr:glycosyltransferase [Planctomycetota bacterium]
MRIALCSYEVAGVRGGGIGTYVAEAGRALTAAGHEVWLVTSRPDAGTAGAADERAFARVLFVEDARTPRHEVHFGLARQPLRFAQLAFDLLRQSDAVFDYVEFPDYGAWGAVAVQEQRLFGSLGDAVVAVVLHSPTHECWRYNEVLHLLPPSERELAVLEDDTIRKAPAVWTPSHRLREMVAERLSLPADFADVIRYPMSLPPEPASLPEPKQRLEDLRILYFGRIEPRKGVRQLVDAFARMPELAIECVGRDGPTSPLQTSEVDYLRRRGAANVTFTPPLPREQMLARLRDADLVILPSPWENWPNTCIEAMAAGRVVVGGKNGGMGEMIEHGVSGFVVDGADPADLVRVLREDVGAALPRFAEIGRAAARRIRELSEPGRYVAAIEAFVAAHRGRGRLPAAPRGGRRVSVVVPFYNEPLAVVGEAVDSALAQDHDELEVLVVEDGSPRADKDAILADLGRRDPRVRVLHKDNGGLATARNFAIERATGDFVLCCDADNVLRPDYAAIGVDVFARCPDVMAVVPRFQTFDDGSRRPRVVVQALPFDRPLAVFRNSLGDAGAMLRREVFTEHGLRYDPDVDTYSDWAMWLDLAGRGLRAEVVPRVLYDYRLRKGSLMDEHAWDRHLPMLGVLIDRHLPDCDEEQKALLINLVQGWGVGAIAAALSGHADAWERPGKLARRLRPGSTRFVFADALGSLLERVPPLHRALHWAATRLVAMHGRHKDRRRR